MKVGVINNLYWPIGRGGAETIAKLIAEGLKERGDDVFIISTWNNADKKEGDVYLVKSLYHKLSLVPIIFRIFWHLFNLFNFVNYFKLKKILENEKPDLIITHNLMGVGFLTPLLLRRARIKHIHVLHDMQLIHPSGLMYYKKERVMDGFLAKTYSFLCRQLFSSPVIVISPSAWLMGEHVKRGFFAKSERKIIFNPVIINFAPRASNVHANLQFLYVGQLEQHKGIIYLIEAFNLARKKMGACQLKIIGGGRLLEAVKILVKKNPDIILLGKRDRDFVLESMKNSDYLIMPSVCYENSPTVIYEAASVGLPAIATAIGGTPELIEKFGGLLFEPGDVHDLVEKLIYASENKIEIKGDERVKMGIKGYLDEIGV